MADSSVDLIDQFIWERGVPYGVFERLRRSDPVHWHEEPDGPGFWALTLHEDIRAVSKDPARFSSYAAGVSRLDVTDPVGLAAYRSIVIAQDPPEHRLTRGLVSTIFTPRAISALESPIRSLARSALDQALEKREIDFVADYASLASTSASAQASQDSSSASCSRSCSRARRRSSHWPPHAGCARISSTASKRCGSSCAPREGATSSGSE